MDSPVSPALLSISPRVCFASLLHQQVAPSSSSYSSKHGHQQHPSYILQVQLATERERKSLSSRPPPAPILLYKLWQEGRIMLKRLDCSLWFHNRRAKGPRRKLGLCSISTRLFLHCWVTYWGSSFPEGDALHTQTVSLGTSFIHSENIVKYPSSGTQGLWQWVNLLAWSSESRIKVDNYIMGIRYCFRTGRGGVCGHSCPSHRRLCRG